MSTARLLSFAKIRVKELRLVISGVASHGRGESRWVQLPSRPILKDGELIHEPDGRIKCAKVLEFEPAPEGSFRFVFRFYGLMDGTGATTCPALSGQEKRDRGHRLQRADDRAVRRVAHFFSL